MDAVGCGELPLMGSRFHPSQDIKESCLELHGSAKISAAGLTATPPISDRMFSPDKWIHALELSVEEFL